MNKGFDLGRLLPINVIRTGFKEHQYHIIRNDGFAAYQLTVCLGGEGKFICGNQEHTISSGDVFLFSPRVPHEYYPTSKEWKVYFFTFSGDSVENIFKYFNFHEVEVFSSTSEEIKNEIFNISKKLSSADNDYSSSLYMYELLGELSKLSRAVPETSLLEKNERFQKMAPVLEYMRKNYKEPLELGELAEMIDVSKSYLCRIFRETYGVTPIKYLMNYRIIRAKQLLGQTDIKLKYLCKEVGFNDASYFCMIFKKSEGMTPDEFRSLHND